MQRQFTIYKELPIGEAQLRAMGWIKHDQNGCDPALGFGWTEAAAGQSKSKPMALYTTAGGQPAGVGVIILGHGEEPLPAAQQKWATSDPIVPVDVTDTFAHVDVAFRSGDIMCSGGVDEADIGDVLVLNPKGASMHIPLNYEAAQAGGWHRGSCFDGMGWHSFFDTSLHNGMMSWDATNLLPIVAMYHEGNINAIFFASTINQVTVPLVTVNEWEPVALSNPQMCQNTCDADCDFDGLTSKGPWSTMHVYFRDHSTVTCDQSLSCAVTFPFRGACCEAHALI